MRLKPPDGTSIFGYQPELAASFWRFYGELWSNGELDQSTKEVARLRNARLNDCGI